MSEVNTEENRTAATEPRSDQRLVRGWRLKRRKWLRPLATEPLCRAVSNIEEMPMRQLKATLRAMDSVSQTNCWWAEYRSAEVYRKDVQNAIRRRSKIANKEIAQ